MGQQEQQSIGAPLLLVGRESGCSSNSNVLGSSGDRKRRSRLLWFCLTFFTFSIVGLIYGGDLAGLVLSGGDGYNKWIKRDDADIVESEKGVVAADDGRCSEIGASFLRQGGHAVDAAVATALCVGVVNPMSSGIGGGAFMVVRSASTSKVQAFDMRETAPMAASENMYENNIHDKYDGALAIGVPGEIAGLHEAWLRHGRLAWRTLFQPAITLARHGFAVGSSLSSHMVYEEQKILNDPGLSEVFAPNGKLLQTGEMCYNVELARSLEAIAEQGPQALHNGTIGEKLIRDVRKAGGILTMEDLKNYKVDVMDAMEVNAMGYTIYGMPPPSSGTLAMSMVLNIFDGYGSDDAAKGDLGMHRLVEAMKHMLAIRMDLGDPDFEDIAKCTSDMLSRSYADKIRKKILDNTTFPSDYYMARWSQLQDHGTSHFSIVDSERNAVSMTTTVNYVFGAGILSPSTGIVLNNEMGDFSAPTEISPDMLPPAPTNYVKPNKRPLSSMTPIVVTKGDQLVGALGGSGGLKIMQAVIQVFLNHFVLGMEPLDAVQSPRIYHKLMPNVVSYENWTCSDGEHIELTEERKHFLAEKGHKLQGRADGAIVQLIVQELQDSDSMGRKHGRHLRNDPRSRSAMYLHNDPRSRGVLTAVSDPRKGGRPAAV